MAAPHAVILSGPDFYEGHLTRVYGGYKRTKNLYGRATYQRDPAQEGEEAFLYFSLADRKWCVGTELGACIKDPAKPGSAAPPVLMYQAAGTEPDAAFPALRGFVSWAADLSGAGHFQFDHLIFLEPLSLPNEAADPNREYGGCMHILASRTVDYEFPPAAVSLLGDVPLESERPVWRLGAPLAQLGARAPLFTRSTEPTTADFAGLGSCDASEVTITRAVLAAVREYPEFLEGLMSRSLSVNERGLYWAQLFDPWQRRWRQIKVDEYMPVLDEQPWAGGAFHPLWVMLLEKALAKLCGSYEALSRSQPGGLLLALTGRAELRRWRKDAGWWCAWRHVLPLQDSAARWGQSYSPGLHRRVTKARPLRCVLERVGGTWQQNEDFMALLRELHQQNALLLAWKFPGDRLREDLFAPGEDPGDLGLVQGHGYSVLDFLVEDFRLVQLRNPWPDKPWRGGC
ncbi:unnamed protein product [Effrenium voratum]|uniref:Calpain catalytic domain-containing protein n=1 Tax=Effrenium voratum TaxID=2562239 RepID=A0AA36MYX5_9DINO|nr:unnamed protein product [Effrenium voratum]